MLLYQQNSASIGKNSPSFAIENGFILLFFYKKSIESSDISEFMVIFAMLWKIIITVIELWHFN